MYMPSSDLLPSPLKIICPPPICPSPLRSITIPAIRTSLKSQNFVWGEKRDPDPFSTSTWTGFGFDLPKRLPNLFPAVEWVVEAAKAQALP
jgi:hypothetical protein